MELKVFLDDSRSTPLGWVRAFWPEEVIEKLKTGQVTHLSLDHDLGNDQRGTGYDVLLWIEEQIALHDFVPPHISLHTDNASARIKMNLALTKIQRMMEAKNG